MTESTLLTDDVTESLILFCLLLLSDRQLLPVLW